MTTQTTNRNPLNPRPLTAAEYASLTRTAQIKAGWNLQAQLDRLEAAQAPERAQLSAALTAASDRLRLARRTLQRREDAIIAASQDTKRAEAEMAADVERSGKLLTALKLERSKLRRKVYEARRRVKAAEEALAPALALAEEAEARLAAARTRQAAALNTEAIEHAEHLAALRAENTLRRVRAKDPAELDDGERHLLDLDRELADLSQHRKARKAVDGDLRPSYPLAG